jgi:hypothetical protein
MVLWYQLGIKDKDISNVKQIRNPQMKLFQSTPEDLVRKDHPYQKLLSIINFSELTKPL